MLRRITKRSLVLYRTQHMNGNYTLHNRHMGFFSDLKKQYQQELEKNEDLKNSINELKQSREQFKNVEKAAKEKFAEFSSKTEDAAKSIQDKANQASQRLKSSVEDHINTDKKDESKGVNSTNDGNATESTKENAKSTQNAKVNEEIKDDTKPKAENENQDPTILDEAKEFINKISTGYQEQRDRFSQLTSFRHKWKDEWKEAVKELFGSNDNQSVDDALSAVKTPTMQQKPKKGEEKEEETKEYTGTSALVSVKADPTAWQKVSARFREAPIIQNILNAAKEAAKTEAGRKVSQQAKRAKDKIGDTKEDLLEFWETSQNPWIYRLSSIYDGLFGETSMGIAIKEIRRAEPDFDVEEWKNRIAEIVLPGVIEAFLRGNSKDLKKWFGEACYARFNAAIRERKSEGLVMDPNVLGIDHVDVIEASAADKQAPILLVRFQSQQINCIRNRDGEVVDGAEDEVLAYYYIFAFQRSYDEEQQALRWRIVDIQMQRGDRYY